MSRARKFDTTEILIFLRQNGAVADLQSVRTNSATFVVNRLAVTADQNRNQPDLTPNVRTPLRTARA